MQPTTLVNLSTTIPATLIVLFSSWSAISSPEVIDGNYGSYVCMASFGQFGKRGIGVFSTILLEISLLFGILSCFLLLVGLKNIVPFYFFLLSP